MKNFQLIVLLTFPLQSIAMEITSANLRSLLQEKNVRVAAAKLQTEAAEVRKGSLSRSFLPHLELYGSQESFKSGDQAHKEQPHYGAELTVNLYNGGRDKLQSEIRTLQHNKKTFQHMRVESEELEKARTAYWQTLYNIEKISLLKSSITINDQNLKAADRRINSGVATATDRIEFEMKAEELKQEFDEATLGLKVLVNTLAVFLDIDEPGEIVFSEKLNHEHDYESAIAHSPKDHAFLYKENEIQYHVSRLEAANLGRTWLPKLEAFASYNQYNERAKEFPNATDRKESAVGVRLTLNLTSGFESSNEAESLEKEALSSQKIALQQKSEIELHITNEMDELELLHGQVHAAEENILRAEKYYKMTQSEYVRGVKNSPDVLGASEKLYVLKNKRNEIIRDFQLAKSHVLSKIGK